MPLPIGPRSTYSLPPTPQPSSRDLARAILDTIRTENARASEVRVGLMSTGCDGEPVLDPLDGTGCGNGGRKVLFHPRTRTVIGTLGKPAGSVPKTVTTLGGCDAVRARLKAKRRFIDNTGNVYGPTGKFLTWAHAPAALETDYVHRLTSGLIISINGTGHDPTRTDPFRRAYLEKRTGMNSAILSFDDVVGSWPPPTAYETGLSTIITTPSDNSAPDTPVLEDCTFGGTYTGPSTSAWFYVYISSLGTPDTFSWWAHTGLAWAYSGDIGGASNVPMMTTSDGDGNIVPAAQVLSYGVWVKFGATTGHSLYRHYGAHDGDLQCSWFGTTQPNGDILRYGVAARGAVKAATQCINGGFPNSNVILTTEDDIDGTHTLRVRDADSLELLYTKSLGSGDPFASSGTGPMCFSANAEGLFFMHCYLTAEPGIRKVAVISVDPKTFEPTIQEVLTLEDNAHTAGATFAVATTLP